MGLCSHSFHPYTYIFNLTWISTSGQDGETRTRFALPPKTTPKQGNKPLDKIHETKVFKALDIGNEKQ